MATKYKDWNKQSIKAAFYALPDRLQKIIDAGNFNKDTLFDDVLYYTDMEGFPIWRIPQCWKIAIGDVNMYRDSCQDAVRDFVKRNDAVMEIFAREFGVEYTTIDFQKYHECYYSEEPDWSDEDIISDAEAEVLKKKFGTRPVDVQLFCAVVRFDFPRVKELLEQGANPYATVYDDGSGDAFSRIGDECSYLCTCCLSWAWDTEKYEPLEHHELEDLIGWAAHETMYAWMKKYNTVPDPYEVESVIPATTREAFAIFDEMVSQEDKKAFIAQSGSEFVVNQQMGLGLWIRNNWIYGQDDDESPEVVALRDRCFRMLAGMKEGETLFDHPDDVSGRFLKKYYDHLKRTIKKWV